jgi:hypothetical protein
MCGSRSRLNEAGDNQLPGSALKCLLSSQTFTAVTSLQARSKLLLHADNNLNGCRYLAGEPDQW